MRSQPKSQEKCTSTLDLMISILLFLALIIFFSGNANAALIAYYEFEEDFTDTVGNFDGSAFNVEFVEGPFNMAADFNGSSSGVELPSDTINDMYAGTVSVWVRLDSVSGQHTIIAKTETFVADYFQLLVQNSLLRLTIGAGRGPGLGGQYVFGNIPLNAGEWTHVAVTWNGVSRRMYVNGVLDVEYTDISAGVVDAQTPVTVGNTDFFQAYLEGLIDNLQIYDHELSDSEIANLAAMPSSSLVLCPGDVNSDGVTDIAVVTPDGQVTIKSITGSLVNRFALSDVNQSIDAIVVPDLNRNGSAELAVLGSATAEIRDPLTGAQVSLITFDPVDTPVDLELFGSGSEESHLAILDQGLVQAQIRTAIGSALIGNTQFSKYIDVLDLEPYPDLNGDSVPDLAVLANRDSRDKSDKLEIRDPVTGAILREIYLNRDWQHQQHEWVVDTNGNGYPEAAILRTSHYTAPRYQVILLDTSPVRQHLGFIHFDANYPPLRLLKIGDINGNGSDEVVVFGQRFNGGNQKAQVKDSKTGKRINAVFFDKNFAGHDINTCADINGNGADELVMVGRRAGGGQLRAIVKDSKTSELLGKVNF